MGKDTKVVISGSYRKNVDLLRNVFKSLSSKYTVLSPYSVDWVNPSDEFVRNLENGKKSVDDIVQEHIDAIRDADFIVLLAPDGYVGTSGAMEVGFAHGLGIPVLSTEPVNDETLASLISGIYDVDQPDIHYGKGLKVLQKQYATIAKRSGWSDESARDTMLLLTEEIGELARAVRKHEGLKRDTDYKEDLSDELADVQLYLTHLANNTGVDLAEAVTNKIKKNAKKKA